MNPKEFVQEYAIRSLICCFSGGKDSLVATHYVLSAIENLDVDTYVAHADTGIMLPTTLPFVKDICQKFG